MRVPLSWIKEFIDCEDNPAEIAKKLTQLGLEVESIEEWTPSFTNVIVGSVVEVCKHPNADKLVVATVTDGKKNYQVVCGAPNCRPGIKIAFALPGAVIKEKEGKELVIKEAKVRGVESYGMLCSGQELQLSEEDDGILELPASFQEGSSLDERYKDIIFDISLTPNLNHCASVFGVARELSAFLGSSLHFPKVMFREGQDPIQKHTKVTIEDQEGCPRYTCRLIKNVHVGPSPTWLTEKLKKSGVRSVNNIVDVTNYVLLEFGHPLHAFDFDRLEGRQIIVKKAEEGHHFKTLDGKEHVLKDNDVMIFDALQPIAIGGIMGGQNSEVHEKTKNVLLESAYFDPVCIRKTSKRLGLQTDSSKHFERGSDPNQLIASLDRACMLIQEVSGGEICSGNFDVSVKQFPEKIIHCRLSRINQILGLHLGFGEVESILQHLRFRYHWDGQDAWTIHIPTYRVDIFEEIDIIEEVARFYGYDNIKKEKDRYQTSEIPHTPIYLFEKEMRLRLMNEGLQEFITCDLIGPTAINVLDSSPMDPNSMIRVLNPTSIEQSILRTSLLPGLLQVVKYNFDHQNENIGGFEIGRIHFKEGEHYKEQSVAAIILSGKSRPLHWDEKAHPYDFFDLKGIVENILHSLKISNYTFKNLGIETFHSGRQASIFVDSLEIGSFGEIHPAVMRKLDVTHRILFGEFNLHDLVQAVKPEEKIKELEIYPGMERDWTVTIKETVPYLKIMQLIQKKSSPHLKEAFLLDIYRNEKLGVNFQNMTFRFVYRDPTRTLLEEEVKQEHEQLIEFMMSHLHDDVKQ